MAVGFVAFNSTASFDVDASTTLLVVVITRNDAVGSGATCQFDPVVGDAITMDVASNSNDWTQIYYLVNPPDGTGEVFASGTNVEKIYSGQYSGDLSFDSAQQGADTDSFSFSPTSSAVMVYGMIAFSTSHTPLAGSTERADADGSYYCDRLESSGGTYSVGITSGDLPDAAGALFVEPATGVDASGTPTALTPTASGTATVEVAASGTQSAPIATASGTATVVVDCSGDVSSPAPTISGTATVVVSASGSVAAPSPTASGTSAITLPGVDVSGSVGAPLPTASGTAILRLGLPGATTGLVIDGEGASSVVTTDAVGLAVSDGSSAVASVSATVRVRGGRGSSSVVE